MRIAYVGIGNRGRQNIKAFAATGMVDVTVLCDVDLEGPQCKDVLEMYPKAKKFKDFREMFEKAGSDFDAVAISTPDHSHFAITMQAIKENKHVYVEKPLTRTFLEAELLMQAAKQHPGVVTQLGNQGHSEANYFQFKAWKDAGILKDVTAITAHMNNPRRWHKYDVNMKTFPQGSPAPRDIDWDTWLMGCRWHDYSEEFHQGNWRSWYDFGMGALGDWGAHIIDTAHQFLDLGLPYEITLQKGEGHNDYFFPMSSTILFRFGARNGMPPVDITWYDGVDNLPPLPEGYKAVTTKGVPGTNQGKAVTKLSPGKIIYTKDHIFKGGSHGSTLSFLNKEEAADMAGKLPEVPESTSNHYLNFLRACLGEEKTRSPFEVGGTLSQVLNLGVIAQRMGTQLFFDPRTKRFTNNEFANAMLSDLPPRKGWEDFYKL